MSHKEYVNKLRSYVPSSAFLPAPSKLLRILLHLGIILSGYIAIRFTSPVFLCLLLSIVIGQSLVCIGFLAHELSHGAIVSNKIPRYLLEAFLWGINLIPATMWRRVHNQTHHIHANTLLDPDRPFLASEKSWITRLYTNIFYPQRLSIRFNPLVALHLTGYTARNVAAAFSSAWRKPRFVPACPRYSLAQRWAILAEIGFMLSWQAAVFCLVGSSWRNWIWASLVPYVFASGLVMSYIFTNHFLNPISETHDPLAHTTSVVVPRWMDHLHQHFSLHTEHHLFPSINSDFYPVVATALKKEFPERYNVLPLAEAWRRLWRREYFVEANEVAEMPSKKADVV